MFNKKSNAYLHVSKESLSFNIVIVTLSFLQYIVAWPQENYLNKLTSANEVQAIGDFNQNI
jgi:hypothetical protein